ncbi:probable potassium transport system protein kup [Methylocaldum marinum]|uniref:Probable potassium transport system protein Kup n=1 Tax=Methylocaldum marinum TaxID=1432792 RepID=A0A250KNT0_9GAMM|nr:potassium transporter Kup [Methylocaldum marinum]BBA33196.1 probable potassium transport system protein kup [Methylocaldum marinum]
MQAHTTLQSLRPGRTVTLVGTLGVVFGDIGTSPLYTMRVAFSGPHAIAPSETNILGVLSLILWSLIVIVSIKYATIMLRADSRGEGGIMVLLSLASRTAIDSPRRRRIIVFIGLIGAALFYGDGILTPAVTVTSAVEGLTVVAPKLGEFVVPTALTILTLLFLLQRKGTSRVGWLFGPIMLLWFCCIGLLGFLGILAAPEVLAAANPWYGARFLIEEEWYSLVVLGAVVLAVTGAETLYADIGHFGVGPIRTAWFGVAFPALSLNYFGQGALLLRDPAAAQNPFYLLAPEWGALPMLVLATVTTVIASQAVISGVFSTTLQAVQLGYLPRVSIYHTSLFYPGQIYMPAVNWILLAAIFALVVQFEASDRLAAAYGIAVTGTMVITSLLAFFVLRKLWQWGWIASLALVGSFLIIDSAFLTANSLKFTQGGWIPLAVGAVLFIVMTTWQRGRSLLASRLNERAISFETLLMRLRANPPRRICGTAVYLTSGRRGVPQSLLNNLAINKILHERVIVLTVIVKDVPWVPRSERIKIRCFGDELYRVKIYFGFNQEPNVPGALALCKEQGLEIELAGCSFFFSREALISTPRPGMALWRERLFIRLARNTESAMDFFRIPPDRVIELGTVVEI